MTTLREAAQQALEALEELNGWQSLAPPLASQAARQATINLRAALEQPEQQPTWRLSCGCPSHYGGILAEWPETTREGDPAVACGVVCEKHWHEYLSLIHISEPTRPY